MTEPIAFKSYNIDIVGILCSPVLPHLALPQRGRLPQHGEVFGPEACRIIKLAFSCGGYVAGGFARLVAHHLKKLNDYNARFNIVRYLGTNDPIRASDRSTPCWRIGHSDIDLFFPDVVSVQEFVKQSMRSGTEWEDSPSGACADTVCDGNTRVSVILRFTAPLEDQVRSFDIYNAMCAFDANKLYVAEHWHALDSASTLHVVNWSSPYIIRRISKWFQKHDVKQLTPETSCEMGKHALDIICRLKKEPLLMPWQKLYTHDQVVHKLKQFLPMLNNEDLLLLMSVYPIDAYQSAFNVLRRRAEAAIEQHGQTF